MSSIRQILLIGQAPVGAYAAPVQNSGWGRIRTDAPSRTSPYLSAHATLQRSLHLAPGYSPSLRCCRVHGRTARLGVATRKSGKPMKTRLLRPPMKFSYEAKRKLAASVAVAPQRVEYPLGPNQCARNSTRPAEAQKNSVTLSGLSIDFSIDVRG